METFKICKKTNEGESLVQLKPDRIVLSGSELCLIIDKEDALELSVGSMLHFEKTASGGTFENPIMLKVCEEDTPITKIVDEDDKRYVYFEYIYINYLTLSSFLEIEGGEYSYKLYFTTDHFMLPCDLDKLVLYVRRGKNIIQFTGLALCYPGELVPGEDDYGTGFTECCDEEARLFNYETMERNSILAKSKEVVEGTDFTPEPGDQAIFSTNPFFSTGEDGETQILYRCFDDDPHGLQGEEVKLYRYNDYMGVGIVLEQDYDAKRMFQEYQVNDLFVKKIKNSIIPDFIDLEKIKFAPAYCEADTGETTDNEEDTILTWLATGLTFNMHFRTRVSGDTPYTFEDVWHFDVSANTWNGSGGVEDTGFTREQLYDEVDFVNSSDLMGWLGFTDEDIYNQKNRVKKSFIRLSFYDDENPLTQNLLYYSTIFFDSGDLYGKFVKRNAWLEDIGDTETPVVWSSASTTDPVSAVTCQMVVNDEYDMTRSGEGFNLYLFKEDAPVENEVLDIYMKVEFNHAGYGRTVPMINWPKDENGKPEALTIENYLENLYIPIEVRLTERGYVYSFPDTTPVSNEQDRKNGILWENDRLVFNLFEPMIEQTKPQTETENNG